MDDLILITYLNDFVFCPASIYFHNLYGARSQFTYQQKPQLDGKAAHETIDNQSYYKNKSCLTGLDIYSETYGLVGKIDIYNAKTYELTERKKKINSVFDGYIFQLYAQYYCMIEMGYKVSSLALYSMDDNRKYCIQLPEDNKVMQEKFVKTIYDIRTTDIANYRQLNIEKCKNCIYVAACDRR